MGKGFGIRVNEAHDDLDIRVQRDATGKITQGLVLGDITYQNINALLTTYAGEIKDNPTVGVGIADMTLDNDQLEWLTRIRQGLENEGLTIRTLNFDNDQKLKIDANYR